MRKIIIVVLFIFFDCQILHLTAQSSSSIIPPSPIVSTIEKYGEYGCTSYTGQVDISIPIYELVTSRLNLPITLKYVSNGRKASPDESCVGLGWMLDLGGVISRTVIGMPDLVSRWDYTSKNASEYNINNESDLSELLYLCGLHGGSANTLDSEHDIYRYNFLSHSGSFIVEQKKENNIEKNEFTLLKQAPISIEYDGSIFSLKDEKGNQYIFGADQNVETTSTPKGQATTAWYLTKIISADKEDIITLKYTKYNKKKQVYLNEHTIEDSHYGIYRNKGYSTKDNRGFILNEYRICQITDIISNRGSVSFIYNELNNTKLSTIVIKDIQGSILKKIDFTINQLKGEFFLDKMSVKAKNLSETFSYKFEYFPTTEVNQQCSDWWGYFNRLMPTQEINLPYTNVQIQDPNYGIRNHSFGVVGCKDANYDCMLYGMLKTITYPTGGTTTFVYEPNKIRNEDLEKNANGLRVARLINDDGSGKKNTRAFIYGNNGCGYHPVYPKLEYFSEIYHFFNAGANCPGYNINADVCPRGSFRQRIYKSEANASISMLVNKPIQYETVTEYMDDGSGNIGKTEYRYKTGNYSIGRFQMSGNAPEGSGIIQLSSDIWHYHPVSFTDYSEGVLLEKIISKKEDNTYKEIYKLNNHYDFSATRRQGLRVRDIIKDYNSGHVLPDLVKVFKLPLFALSNYYIEVGCSNLIKIEEIENGVKTVTENIFNSKSVLKTVTFTNSQNIQSVTNYTYCTDINNPPGSISYKMTQSHMIGIPIEKSISVDGKEVERIKTNYINDSEITMGLILPGNIEKSTTNPNNKHRIIQFQKYDRKGNLLQYKGLDDIPTSYIWSYNYQYPIAEIKNATYAEVNSALSTVGLTSIDALSTNINPDKIKLDKLRTLPILSNAMITTYKYQPLVGMLESTDPSGITTYYEYDTSNRLRWIRDQEHKSLVYNEYKYKNEPIPTAPESLAPLQLTKFQGAQNCFLKGNEIYSVDISGGSGNYRYYWKLKDSSGMIIQEEQSPDNKIEVMFASVGNMALTCTIVDVDLSEPLIVTKNIVVESSAVKFKDEKITKIDSQTQQLTANLYCPTTTTIVLELRVDKADCYNDMNYYDVEFRIGDKWYKFREPKTENVTLTLPQGNTAISITIVDSYGCGQAFSYMEIKKLESSSSLIGSPSRLINSYVH